MDASNQVIEDTVPAELENTQDDVNVDTAHSKIGFLAFLMSFLVWIFSAVVLFFFLIIRSTLFPSAQTGPTPMSLADAVVLLVSALVPVVPLLWYLIRRVQKILVDSPASAEDLFFKYTIRVHLALAMTLAVLWIFILIYNILSKTILNHDNISVGIILDSVIFVFIPSFMAYFFYYIKNMTRG